MKTFKYVLIAVLIFVVIVTGYYTFKRYIINDGLKGVSPDNILNIFLFLILPIIIGLFIIKRLEKKR